MTAKNRRVRGISSGQAKLTEADVRAIRAACAAGELQKVVAARFGVTAPAVSVIVLHKGWKHVAPAQLSASESSQHGE